MLRKALHFLTVHHCKISQVRHSALFVNGAKATEQFVYVTPHVDVSEQLKEKDATQHNLNKRKSTINLNKVEDLWTVYEVLKTKRVEYEKMKADISRELGQLIKSEPNSDMTKKLRIQIDLLKENIKKLKMPLWSAEEAAMSEALKLPNQLHLKTQEKDTVLYTHLSPPTYSKNHLKIGQDRNLIKFIKNENYYLMGDAAIFELGAKFHFNSLLKKHNFVQFSNPDFVKSLIVEGCGNDHTNPDSSFILHHNEESTVNKDSRLHLSGAASLCSFLAYHTKCVIYPKVLPLKYFTMGRQYIPSAHKEDSLFHVSQSSAIEIFGVTKSANDLDRMLEEVTDMLQKIYIGFGYHFQLSIASADKLEMWESLRVIIQMYSTSLNSYVEVGNISLSGDFISKRLMFTYIEDKENNFPHLLSGTVLNVPKFLACVLEQDNDFQIPEMFKVEKWTL